jgi:hypothetical protein
MSLAVALRSSPYDLTVVNPGDLPLAEVARHGASAAAAVIELTGAETVVELRELLRIWAETRCLFVVRTMPLRATLARIVSQHGGVILSKDERPIVITATLITMMMDVELTRRHDA